ncbi:hypothetical protein L9F63_009274 [Diploptera punctata]|uniref:Translation initiation factor eIF2B subunit beta n=1 Tax=Diploptera punctata TaxID=6984 RepID=A0AAD8ERU9_DIPPU|nr:hypothetical protein L9F63_009274 [Diploptera punctata]
MPEIRKNIDEKINKFVNNINQGKLWGSYDIAYNTVDLLKEVIVEGNWKTAKELVERVSAEGRKLTKSLPLQASVGNMVRRILKIIREEYVAMQRNKQEEVDPQESLHKIVTSEGDGDDDYSKPLPDLQASIMEHIGEFEMELETSADNIAQQARQHIHSNEIIMTLGKSASVEAFLKKAATERKFEVIVAESAPFCRGHELAVSLGKSKIQTTLSRLSNLCHNVSTKHYSVPVIVLAPMYKLSPQYLCSYDQDAFNSFVSPEGVLNYSDGSILSKVHVYNPVFDYVPPELVTLFISNTGGHAPSYIYRLLSELYHPEDHDL